jgi:hypothetical protein
MVATHARPSLLLAAGIGLLNTLNESSRRCQNALYGRVEERPMRRLLPPAPVLTTPIVSFVANSRLQCAVQGAITCFEAQAFSKLLADVGGRASDPPGSEVEQCSVRQEIIDFQADFPDSDSRPPQDRGQRFVASNPGEDAGLTSAELHNAGSGTGMKVGDPMLRLAAANLIAASIGPAAKGHQVRVDRLLPGSPERALRQISGQGYVPSPLQNGRGLGKKAGPPPRSSARHHRTVLWPDSWQAAETEIHWGAPRKAIPNSASAAHRGPRSLF